MVSKALKVIVCGGRDFQDAAAVSRGLDYFQEAHSRIAKLAHGGARGADILAGEWARDEHIPVVVYPARWKEEGKRAGPNRNQRMLLEFRPDVVIAFPGGVGTADMIRRAESQGVRVVRL